MMRNKQRVGGEKSLNLFKVMHKNNNHHHHHSSCNQIRLLIQLSSSFHKQQKAWKTSTVGREQEAHVERPPLAHVIFCYNVDLQDKSRHPLSVGLHYIGRQNPFSAG